MEGHLLGSVRELERLEFHSSRIVTNIQTWISEISRETKGSAPRDNSGLSWRRQLLERRSCRQAGTDDTPLYASTHVN